MSWRSDAQLAAITPVSKSRRAIRVARYVLHRRNGALYDQIDHRCSRPVADGVRDAGANTNTNANAAAADRHPRDAARANRALSGFASRTDVDECDRSGEGHRARQVD